jgi:hypothetical protein
MHVLTNITATGNSTAVFGGFRPNIEINDNFNYGTIVGVNPRVAHNGTGTVTGTWGVNLVTANTSTGTITTAYGANMTAENEDGGGVIGVAVGGNFNVKNSSSGGITSAYAGSFEGNNNKAGATITDLIAGKFNITANAGIITNAYGIRIDLTSNAGSMTNMYGLYIADVTTGTQTNQAYGIYQEDTSARNYFGGNVGIGTASPSERLEVFGDGDAVISINDTDFPQLKFKEGGTQTAKIYTSGQSGGELRFDTATTLRMRIDEDGNVGIGTANPGHLLDVQAVTDPSIRVRSSGTGSSDDALVRIRIGGTTANSNILFGDSASANVGQIVYSHGTDAMRLYTAGAEKMRISSTGNVGIGNTNPIAKLFVDGGALGGTAGDEVALLSLRTTTTNADTLQFTSERLTTGTNFLSAAQRIQRKIDTTLMGYIQFGASTDDLITFGEGNTEYMRIDGDGNVGIGTTSPGELLDVDGNIKIKAALLSNQENTDVDTGTETVASVAIATYTAAFFDFVVKKGTNVRSGTVYACHDGTSVEFTETSTNDLGDTSDVRLSVDISGANMRLLAIATSDDWSVKSLIRAI